MVAVMMEVTGVVMMAEEETSKLPEPDTLTLQWQNKPYSWGFWGNRMTEGSFAASELLDWWFAVRR